MTIQEMLNANFTKGFEEESLNHNQPSKYNIHIPVMKEPIMDALRVKDGGFYIDGTFGAGGHSQAMLERGAVVLALDRDQEAIERADKMSVAYPNTLVCKHSSFADIDKIWGNKAAGMKADGVLLDLGFSSNQIEDADRGFAFSKNGQLDMRFDLSQEMSAKDWVNTASKEEMAHIFETYGQEKNALAIAKAIVKARKIKTIETTFDLVNIIGQFNQFDNKHAATRIFQAIRIRVNDEFEHINKALIGAKNVLKYYGRLAVLTFHSLEDRIVKEFFANEVSFLQLPSQKEIEQNPRARSAKLRWMIKTDGLDR